MPVHLMPAFRLQLLHNGLDVLRLVLVGNKNAVGRGDHHDILKADNGYEPAFSIGQAVVAIEKAGIAQSGIALGILVQDRPDRRPGTQVVPFRCNGRADDVVRLFHDGVVDGNVVQCFEGFLVQSRKIQIPMPCLHDGDDVLVKLQLVLLESINHRIGGIKKDAGIPDIAAVLQEGIGTVLVRLLNKGFHRPHRLATTCNFDVSVSGVGFAGFDAEGHDLACVSGCLRLMDGSQEKIFLPDQVVGGQQQDQAFGSVSAAINAAIRAGALYFGRQAQAGWTGLPAPVR